MPMTPPTHIRARRRQIWAAVSCLLLGLVFAGGGGYACVDMAADGMGFVVVPVALFVVVPGLLYLIAAAGLGLRRGWGPVFGLVVALVNGLEAAVTALRMVGDDGEHGTTTLTLVVVAWTLAVAQLLWCLIGLMAEPQPTVEAHGFEVRVLPTNGTDDRR